MDPLSLNSSTIPASTPSKRKKWYWNKKDDSLAYRFIEEYKQSHPLLPINWNQIANAFNEQASYPRSERQIQRRYTQFLQKSLKKTALTEDEKNSILQFAQQHDSSHYISWKNLANKLERCPEQIRAWYYKEKRHPSQKEQPITINSLSPIPLSPYALSQEQQYMMIVNVRNTPPSLEEIPVESFEELLYNDQHIPFL